MFYPSVKQTRTQNAERIEARLFVPLPRALRRPRMGRWRVPGVVFVEWNDITTTNP